jgi:hypothetical protein
MLFSHLVTTLPAVPLAAGYLVTTPHPAGSTVVPLTITNCNVRVVVASSIMSAINDTYGITIVQFEAMIGLIFVHLSMFG